MIQFRTVSRSDVHLHRRHLRVRFLESNRRLFGSKGKGKMVLGYSPVPHRGVRLTLTYVLVAGLTIFNQTELQNYVYNPTKTESMKKAIVPQLPEENIHATGGEETTASLVPAPTTSTPAKGDRDDDSPAWFRSYLSWHAQSRSQLNETNWRQDNYDYLLLRCVPDEICEGAADRLKHVPVMLMLAAKAEPKRLFFIHWSKPCALEEFLIPPAGGLDWTLPSWLADKMQANSMVGPYLKLNGHDLKGSWNQTTDQVVRLKTMTYAHGVFEAFRDPDKDPDFWTSYSSIWNAVFTPSPGVQAAIDQTKRDLGIELGNYNGIHVRARYAQDKVNNRVERYALQCLVSLPNATRTNVPVFMATDSAQTIREAVAHGESQNITVVGRVNATEPLHLDRGSAFLEYGGTDWQNHAPLEFYDTFVDLYILAGSTCMAHGEGGFGSWATLMGTSRTCSIDYKRSAC